MSSVREKVFDELKLTIQPTAMGRKIVVEDKSQARSLSADGQIYADEVWRVKLYNGGTFSAGRQPMISVTYIGKHAPAGSGSRVTRRVFRTGEFNLRLIVKTDGDATTSRIDITDISHDDILDDRFGIWNGYAAESPNQSWEGRGMCVVSDGTVTCEFGDYTIVSPTLEDLTKARMVDDVKYTVSAATWTVVCEVDSDDESMAKITLYTDSENLEAILSELDKFLDEMGLTRFDDLLA